MAWITAHLTQIVSMLGVVSEVLAFTPVGGIVKGIAQLIGVIAGALGGSNPPPSKGP